jgi:hypothetical protein
MSVRMNFAFGKSEICIENSVKYITSSRLSVQFSIENHSKWQPWTGRLVDWWTGGWVIFLLKNCIEAIL